MARRIRVPIIQLNEAQQEIVDFNYGPLIVNSTAGSGKTRSVIERIARMIKDGTVKPERILATTFTKKAAIEMNERLEAKGIDTRRMAVQTTHSFCWRIMREHRNHKGWAYDEKDRSTIIIKTLLNWKNMDWKDVDKRDVIDFISKARNSLLSPAECVSMLQGEYADDRFKEVYTKYDHEMRLEKLATPDDMLYYGVRLMRDDQKVQDKVQRIFQFVMVDEAQDSNEAQIQLAHIVAAPEYNLVVVGDSDQGIYAWRGAVPEYFVDFKDKYDAHQIDLSINYRCAPCIVEAAAKCINHNEVRIPKDMIAARDYETNIHWHSAENTDDEATIVGENIQAHMGDGIRPGNIIVLMRTNAQSRALEEELSALGIPFVVLGAVSFYERKEIKRVLAYLRCLLDPRDVAMGELALRSPYRHTSAKAHEWIANKTRSIGVYVDAVDMAIDRDLINVNAIDKVVDFVTLMRDINIDQDAPKDILQKIVDDTDFLAWLDEDDGSESLESDRKLNVNELIRSSGRFNTVEEFIRYIDRQIKLRKKNDNKKQESRVQIMSIHKSKGTEAPVVFLIGANEGIIPHSKGEIEEERRLFFVAMTRAKDALHISAIRSLIDNGVTFHAVPSRFAFEAGIVPMAAVDYLEEEMKEVLLNKLTKPQS